MNNICVIYDQDEQYAKRLMHMMGESSRIPYGMQLFTEEKELKSYLEHNEPEILMVSEDCLCEGLNQDFHGKTIILTDQENNWDQEKDNNQINVVKKGQGETIGIYKYQSSEKILQEVIRQANGKSVSRIKKTELVGIFTPVQQTEKTYFSLTLARVLSKVSRVLYICLDEFSGLDDILPAADSVTLSDTIYFYRQNRGQIDEKVLGTIQHRNNLDYIAPVQCAEDISYLDAERLSEFLLKLGEQAGYEKIIVDISYAVRQQWKMIMECTKVYMPVQKDYLSKKKIQAFELFFIAQGMEKLLSRIEKITLPEREERFNDQFWQSDENGGMFDYVRKIL